MGSRRFVSNVLHADEFTKYRIDRVPLYELVRCGLEVPAADGRPVHWLAGNGAVTVERFVSWPGFLGVW